MDLSVLNHMPNINTEINIASIKAVYIRKTLAQIKGTNPFLLQKLPAIKKPLVIKKHLQQFLPNLLSSNNLNGTVFGSSVVAIKLCEKSTKKAAINLIRLKLLSLVYSTLI